MGEELEGSTQPSNILFAHLGHMLPWCWMNHKEDYLPHPWQKQWGPGEL